MPSTLCDGTVDGIGVGHLPDHDTDPLAPRAGDLGWVAGVDGDLVSAVEQLANDAGALLALS